MSEDELVEFACQLFEGKVVPYWKLQSPQPLKVIESSFTNPTVLSEKQVANQKAEQEEREAGEWWQARAKRLVADHRTKFADLATAEVGTRHDPALNKRVKERMKRA